MWGFYISVEYLAFKKYSRGRPTGLHVGRAVAGARSASVFTTEPCIPRRHALPCNAYMVLPWEAIITGTTSVVPFHFTEVCMTTDLCKNCEERLQAKKRSNEIHQLEMTLIENRQPFHVLSIRCGTSRRKYIALRKLIGLE